VMYTVKKSLASSTQDRIFAVQGGEKSIPRTGTRPPVPRSDSNYRMCRKSCPAPVAHLFPVYRNVPPFLHNRYRLSCKNLPEKPGVFSARPFVAPQGDISGKAKFRQRNSKWLTLITYIIVHG
jgi:hypothetical protein